ncbi:hypothetical protein RBI13_04725 [Alcaligenaceae bacterium A4P071]|nr:hypothetical protein [Alcaligenaceae bacterium A4P071]
MAMVYEALFWGMLAVVLGAMAIGVVAGLAERVGRAVSVCVAWAAVAATFVALAQPMGTYVLLNTIAAAATFLFSAVIGVALALVTRRIRRHRREFI